MGLDVYLSGRVFYHLRNKNTDTIDGMPVEEVHVKLGYWRKDWTFHDAMCAHLEDECQRDVSVSANQLREMLGKIQSGELENEDGTIYTGEGCAEYGTQDTLDVLARAIEWIERAPEGEWRDAIYRGSW